MLISPLFFFFDVLELGSAPSTVFFLLCNKCDNCFCVFLNILHSIWNMWLPLSSYLKNKRDEGENSKT